MGQIIFNKQKPKYCNLIAITNGNHAADVPKAGEVWLIDSTNASKPDGTGKYDYYIVGDNSQTTSQLAVNKIRIDDNDVIVMDDAPTSGSDNPVKSQGIKSALDTLNGKINAIIGGNATLSLSVSPTSIFANTNASITVTAIASIQATNINIKKGGTVVQSGSNTTSINYTETVTLNSGETITYSTEGVINGVTKTVSNKTVRAYDKIYYGVGTENSYSGITIYQSIRTNAAGTYTFNITSENQYAYILEPYAMTAINLNNVKLDSGFGYNLQLISDNDTIDGVRYRVYRSAANAAGESFNVVIS